MAQHLALIVICDLNHTQQTIASDIMPAAVGCIAFALGGPL